MHCGGVRADCGMYYTLSANTLADESPNRTQILRWSLAPTPVECCNQRSNAQVRGLDTVPPDVATTNSGKDP
jgi:hypothetical protein